MSDIANLTAWGKYIRDNFGPFAIGVGFGLGCMYGIFVLFVNVSLDHDIAFLNKRIAYQESQLDSRIILKDFPEEIRSKTVQETVEKVRRLLEDLSDQKEELDSKQSKIQALEVLENFKGHFLVRLLTFHREALCYGTTLNFTYDPPDQGNCTEKEELAKKFFGFLKELDFKEVSSFENETPKNAKLLLKQYQESKGVLEEKRGYYGTPVFSSIIIDYYKKT